MTRAFHITHTKMNPFLFIKDNEMISKNGLVFILVRLERQKWSSFQGEDIFYMKVEDPFFLLSFEARLSTLNGLLNIVEFID